MARLAKKLNPRNGGRLRTLAGAPGRRGRLHSAAVDQLRGMIVSGQINPGAPLREAELCEVLGISRSPLREAIRTLAREGLVTLFPNRSAIAATLNFPEIEALFEAIGYLESVAVKLLCSRASDDDIRQISILHHQMLVHYHKRDLKNYIAVNQAIHRAIMRMSGNVVLHELWELLAPRLERSRAAANLYPNRWHAAVLEHEEILRCLVARDSESVAKLMTEHYINGFKALKPTALSEDRLSIPE
jgi:DNA-binding GntR family transcriptional regulator